MNGSVVRYVSCFMHMCANFAADIVSKFSNQPHFILYVVFPILCFGFCKARPTFKFASRFSRKDFYMQTYYILCYA